MDLMPEMIRPQDLPRRQETFLLADVQPDHRLFRRQAVQHLPQHLLHLRHLVGLDQVLEGPDTIAVQGVVGGSGGKNQHAVGIKPPQRAGDRHAIHPLHVDIQKNQVKGLLSGGIQEGGPIRKGQVFHRLPALVQRCFEPAQQLVPIPRVVIHHCQAHSCPLLSSPAIGQSVFFYNSIANYVSRGYNSGRKITVRDRCLDLDNFQSIP